jgi:hypothetical protein
MSNFKRLTSTSNAKDTVVYINPAQHGSTIYFAVAGADGKLANIAVKELTVDINATGSAGPAVAPPPLPSPPA